MKYFFIQDLPNQNKTNKLKNSYYSCSIYIHKAKDKKITTDVDVSITYIFVSKKLCCK